MKLRNLLITAALFCLSASAFANHTWWDQNTESTATRYTYEDNGTPEKSSDWVVTWETTKDTRTYKTDITFGLFTFTGTASNHYVPSVNRNTDNAGTWWILGSGDGERTVTIEKDLGLWAKLYSGSILYSTASSTGTFRWDIANDSSYVFNFDYGTTYSAKITFSRVQTGDTTTDNNTTTEQSGAPLPTPVVTLLIALGFGVAFVMYRNRKQAKA